MAETEPVLKSYRGNCHCGAFIFELNVPEIKSANQCNCSICAKKGYLFTFPGDGLTVVKGEGSLAEYTFNERNTAHKFCPTCGIAVLCYNAKFPAGMNSAINVRTIQGLDISKLEIKGFEGKAIGTPYEPPKYTGPEPIAEIEGGKLYTGSCHCGAVTACLKTKPLDSTFESRIVECNCSMCQRAAYMWIYPVKDQVVVEGKENLAYYVFGQGVMRKAFCKTCGVQVMNDENSLTAEQVEALPAETKAFLRRIGEIMPLNLRILNNFDLGEIKEKVLKMDGYHAVGPMYVNP